MTTRKPFFSYYTDLALAGACVVISSLIMAGIVAAVVRLL